MDRLIIKGGYGEHGRSCFLVPFEEGRYFMLDCGIMDTDADPWPHVEPELLSRTEYLFLSHCHKDHSGAFEQLRSQGFKGWLVTAKDTEKLSSIQYEKTIEADPFSPKPADLHGKLTFLCGRSGHCSGGLWFQIWDSDKSTFYSGDYQLRPLAYAVDPIRGRKAKLAIIDCAHPDTEENAVGLRRNLADEFGRELAENRRILLPLPKYGRGLEMIVLLKRLFPQARLAADEGFENITRMLCAGKQWLQPEAAEQIQAFLEEQPFGRLAQDDYDFLLLSDPHLEKETCRELIKRDVSRGAKVIVTGRVKPDGLVQTLLNEKKAVKLPYPHHQSRGDFEELLRENDFNTVLPFHNDRKEIYIKTT